MIAHIYRETHGVPGRIIAEVSGLSSGAKQGGKLKWILVLAVAAAIAIALGVQWLISSKNNAKKVIAPAAVEQKANNTRSCSATAGVSDNAPAAACSASYLPQQQSVPANEANEAKDALEPSGRSQCKQGLISSLLLPRQNLRQQVRLLTNAV